MGIFNNKKVRSLESENSDLKKVVDAYKRELEESKASNKMIVDENENQKYQLKIFLHSIKEIKAKKRKLADEYFETMDKLKKDIEDTEVKYNEIIGNFLLPYVGRLSKEVIETMYNDLRFLDNEGWYELRIVEKLIPCNIYSEFYYEDNTGVFDAMDNGYQEILYYEIAAFAECEYEFVGMYERMVDHSDYTEKKEYLEYREKAMFQTINEIIKKHSIQAFEILTPFLLESL